MARRRKKKKFKFSEWFKALIEPKLLMRQRLRMAEAKRRAAENALRSKEQENAGLRIQIETFTDFVQAFGWQQRATGAEQKMIAETIRKAGEKELQDSRR
jgi:hypothetical protein